MNEQLISKETAILAEEKGFGIWSCVPSGCILLLNKDTNEIECLRDRQDYPYDNQTLLVTQSLLQKWLREKHNLYICISAEFYKTGINHTLQILCYNPNLTESDYYDNDKCTGMYGDNAEFETYEDALEFGLQKALTFVP